MCKIIKINKDSKPCMKQQILLTPKDFTHPGIKTCKTTQNRK